MEPDKIEMIEVNVVLFTKRMEVDCLSETSPEVLFLLFSSHSYPT